MVGYFSDDSRFCRSGESDQHLFYVVEESKDLSSKEKRDVVV